MKDGKVYSKVVMFQDTSERTFDNDGNSTNDDDDDKNKSGKQSITSDGKILFIKSLSANSAVVDIGGDEVDGGVGGSDEYTDDSAVGSSPVLLSDQDDVGDDDDNDDAYHSAHERDDDCYYEARMTDSSFRLQQDHHQLPKKQSSSPVITTTFFTKAMSPSLEDDVVLPEFPENQSMTFEETTSKPTTTIERTKQRIVNAYYRGKVLLTSDIDEGDGEGTTNNRFKRQNKGFLENIKNNKNQDYNIVGLSPLFDTVSATQSGQVGIDYSHSKGVTSQLQPKAKASEINFTPIGTTGHRESDSEETQQSTIATIIQHACYDGNATYKDSEKNRQSCDSNINFDANETHMRRFSRRVSREFQRCTSEVHESLPKSASGWAIVGSIVATAIIGYEVNLQYKLTKPPHVYGQIYPDYEKNPNSSIPTQLVSSPSVKVERNSIANRTPINDIYHRMKRLGGQNHSKVSSSLSVVERPIQPSLFVGTRAAVASTVAYLAGGPAKPTDRYIKIREVLIMPQDGARIAIDWELPPISTNIHNSTTGNPMTDDKYDQEYRLRKHAILHGPIDRPVVIILHGINNDSSFGYVRSLMRSCTNMGWNAVGFNFRGCGGIPLYTPRGYTGAYTGDLRQTIQILSSRLKQHIPIFLVGNSLGANLVAKYLGEEGLYGTLPSCVAGGVTLGNPMSINSSHMNKFWSAIIAVGAKVGILKNYKYFKYMNTIQYNTALRTLFWKAITLEDFDRIVSPLFVRVSTEPCDNKSHSLHDNNSSSIQSALFSESQHQHHQKPKQTRKAPPFLWTARGYDNAEEYWSDASSSSVLPFVSVPLLQLIARDDFLVFKPHRRVMHKNLCNPNVMVIETACGGHLGWQELPPNQQQQRSSSFNKDISSCDNASTNTSNWTNGLGSSWADIAVVEFIGAVLESYREKHSSSSHQDLLKPKKWSATSSSSLGKESDSTKRQ